MDTSKKRRAIKNQMSTTHLGLEHTRSCTVLPNRNVMLDMMPKDCRVAEIGVAFGDFTKEIISRCQPEKLYLIDSWQSERYQGGLHDIHTAYRQEIDDGTIEVMQGLSTDRLKDIPNAGLDWAYIDTNHSYATTLAELELCNAVVVSDGRIAGHDFCTGNVVGAIPYGVIEAVTEFCKNQRWQFEYLTLESNGHFSFCLKRLVSEQQS